MSYDQEIISAAERMKSGMPDCYGTFDQDDKACTVICKISGRCRKATVAASKPRVSEVKTKVSEELPDMTEMDPLEYLIECAKGRFNVDVSKGNNKGFRFRNGKDVLGTVTVLPDGRTEIVTKTARLRLENGFESCKQANYIFQAILLG